MVAPRGPRGRKEACRAALQVQGLSPEGPGSSASRACEVPSCLRFRAALSFGYKIQSTRLLGFERPLRWWLRALGTQSSRQWTLGVESEAWVDDARQRLLRGIDQLSLGFAWRQVLLDGPPAGFHVQARTLVNAHSGKLGWVIVEGQRSDGRWHGRSIAASWPLRSGRSRCSWHEPRLRLDSLCGFDNQ